MNLVIIFFFKFQSVVSDYVTLSDHGWEGWWTAATWAWASRSPTQCHSCESECLARPCRDVPTSWHSTPCSGCWSTGRNCANNSSLDPWHLRLVLNIYFPFLIFFLNYCTMLQVYFIILLFIHHKISFIFFQNSIMVNDTSVTI